MLSAYYGYGGFYPYCYPHFPTYGYSAWHPRTGAYGAARASTVPTAAPAWALATTPHQDYARGAAAYGPYGARGAAQAYAHGNLRTDASGSNVYGSWGSTSVQRGDDWAQTNRYTNRQTGMTTRTVRTDEGSAVTRRGSNGGTVAVGDGGNVYAGKDGNAYRQQDGTWQKYATMATGRIPTGNRAAKDHNRRPARPQASDLAPRIAARSIN